MPYQRLPGWRPFPGLQGKMFLRAWLRSQRPKTPSALWLHEGAARALPSPLHPRRLPPGVGVVGTAGGPLHPRVLRTMLVGWPRPPAPAVPSVQPLLAWGEQGAPQRPLAKPPLLRGVLCILCSCVYGSKMYNISLLFVADMILYL